MQAGMMTGIDTEGPSSGSPTGLHRHHKRSLKGTVHQENFSAGKQFHNNHSVQSNMYARCVYLDLLAMYPAPGSKAL